MNLAVIEKMVRDGDMSKDALYYLVGCKGECAWLDYKENFQIDSEENLCKFTKDILALKNVGGGYIVIGVRDKTWTPVGISSQVPYDSKMVRDQVIRAAGVDLEIHIVHHTLEISNSTCLFALVFVRSSKKRSKRRTPTLVKKDFCVTKPYGLHLGTIYMRRADSTIMVKSEQELADLLDDLEAQSDQDAISGAAQISPFAIEDGTYRLLEKGYDKFIGRDQLRKDVYNSIIKDPRIWIINVHGPGGVGKSALVNWAVYEHYNNNTFESIIHLTAKESALTPKGIMPFSRSLYSLENLLDHILNTFQEKSTDNLVLKTKIAVEILSAWHILLVLDNMETVQDGRIQNFIQDLPIDTKVKVLFTSRMKTGGWELPIPVNELNVDETYEFMQVRAQELGIKFPCNKETAEKIWQVTGGLPLSIQWILGRCKIEGTIDGAIQAVGQKESPVLEFSFRNIWIILSSDAKSILGAMTIFNEPPTLQQLAIATSFNVDLIEKALGELIEVTLVSRQIQPSDGRVRFVALPITLSFARHQLLTFGEFEVECRKRFQRYSEQMDLRESELIRFRSDFDRYGLTTDNEKKAAILCQRGKSEMFAGKVDNADMLFKEARELAPQCAYVFAMNASYYLATGRVGQAQDYIKEACKIATQKTGALCYTIKAQILKIQNNRNEYALALEKALEFDSDDIVIRHQLGVALSRAGHTDKAIEQFDIIIQREKDKVPPTIPLLMALKTRMINLKRLNHLSELKSDLEWVDKMVLKYQHLATEIHQFDEFRDFFN